MLDPGNDSVNLFLFQTPVALQILDADVLVVCVWRHLSTFDLVRDQRRPGANLVVILKLHRAHTAFTMTDYAVFVDYLGYITVVGDFAILCLRTQSNGQSDGSAKQGGGLTHVFHAGLLTRNIRQISTENSNGRSGKSPFLPGFLRDIVQQIATV